MERKSWGQTAAGLLAGMGMASAAACWPLDYSEEDPVLYTTSATTSGAGGEGGAGGAVPGTDLFVDPLAGSDDAAGTHDEPFKTIEKALSTATDGQTVRLFGGVYGEANGDDFKTQVPEGVSVAAVVPGDAVLLGTDTQTALHFRGHGRAEGLRIEGFLIAVAATKSEVTLFQLGLKDNAIGVLATGTAVATLESSTITQGTSALVTSGNAALAVAGGDIRDIDWLIADVQGKTSITFDGLDLDESAGCLWARGESSVTIRSSTLSNLGTACFGTITVDDTATLMIEDTTITEPQGDGSWSAAVRAGSGTATTIVDGNLTAAVYGIYSEGFVSVDASSLSGLEGATAGIRIAETGSLSLSGTAIDHFATGVMIDGTARIRGSLLHQNAVGVQVGGELDMGTTAEPGGNLVAQNSETGLVMTSEDPGLQLAVGNTWWALNQGTDDAGHFPIGTTFTGPFGGGDPVPRNVYIQLAGTSVKLAPDILP